MRDDVEQGGSVVERGNETENPRNRYAVSTRDPSARKLPTDHEHEVGVSQSSNISVINRRFAHLDHCPILLAQEHRKRGRTKKG